MPSSQKEEKKTMLLANDDRYCASDDVSFSVMISTGGEQYYSF